MKHFSECDEQNSESFCRLDKTGLINDTKQITISKNSIMAGCRHSVGLKSDGTVMTAGDNKFGKCNVSEWCDIVAIAVGYLHKVGLISDGTIEILI